MASSMAKCPICGRDVRTPFFLNLDAWSHLACPQCKARLELKPRPAGIFLLPILISLSGLRLFGHKYAVTAEILMVTAAFALVLLTVVRPKVRLRTKPTPKPEIHLNLNNPSN
jgi:DNA-directed RNA polymerase subunit RPC12/RpoP